MSEHTEDRRLPATWEEYDRAVKLRERAAWIAGRQTSLSHGGRCSTGDTGLCPGCEADARANYPITRKVPRKVALWGGSTARIDDDGHLYFEDEAGWPCEKWGLCPESLDALRDLLNRPYEEVPE